VRLRQTGLPKLHEIHYAQAMALALKKRIVKLEVSDIRQHKVSNTTSVQARLGHSTAEDAKARRESPVLITLCVPLRPLRSSRLS
jgi:hypothetical protein